MFDKNKKVKMPIRIYFKLNNYFPKKRRGFVYISKLILFHFNSY
jgi:hypothetical protein